MPIRTALLLVLLASATIAQPFPVIPTDLGGGVHMLKGYGGNIAILTGDRGTLMVDAQFDSMSKKIKATIGKITKDPVRWVVNTHWHFDHTEGNRLFGEEGAVVVAHENVLRRMSKGQMIEALGRKVEPSPGAALPTITFTEGMSFQWGKETVRITHVRNAHTDGDAIVRFEKANVLHLGDCYFNGLYPFVDASSGGSVDGLIRAVRKALTLCDDKTKIVPGHGPLATRADLVNYLAFLEGTKARLANLLAAGKTVDEIVAMRPLKETDEAMGKAFLKPEQFLRIFIGAMQARPR